MVKKNTNNRALGLLDQLKENSENIKETSNENIDKSVEEYSVDNSKLKSNAGRKKAASTKVTFKNKKVVISPISETKEKKNKTFYLDKKYIDLLQELSDKTNMSTSNLVEIAIDQFVNNVELEGFDNN